MTPLRAGLSGCTAASGALLQRVRRHTFCEIVAAHDPDPAALAAFAAEHGLGTRAASFDALLATGIDFVVLCGDVAARPAQVAAAAAQGVHCLSTSPCAVDLAAGRAMAEAAATAQVRLGVHVPELEDPLFLQLRRMLGADWLGGVVAVQAILGVDSGLRGAAPAPLHPFVELAARHVHLTSWLLGRSAVRVTAQATRTFARDDDGGVATAVLRGNIGCTFAVSRATAVQAFAVHGTDGGVRLAGDRLWLRGRQPYRGPVFDYLDPGAELAISRSELAAELAAAAPAAELVGRFARWIEDCDTYPCPAEAALDDLAVVDALLRAKHSGRCEPVAGA